MTDTVKVLSDDEVAEVAAMFPHAEYQPTLSPDEVDPCEFCKGTIDDHKANCVVPHVHSLCATVRALRQQVAELTAEWCECGHAKTQHGFFSDHDECYECDQMSDDLCCHWRPVPRATDTYTALREQLAQSQAENERLASQLKEWQEEKDTKAGYL